MQTASWIFGAPKSGEDVDAVPLHIRQNSNSIPQDILLDVHLAPSHSGHLRHDRASSSDSQTNCPFQQGSHDPGHAARDVVGESRTPKVASPMESVWRGPPPPNTPNRNSDLGPPDIKEPASGVASPIASTSTAMAPPVAEDPLVSTGPTSPLPTVPSQTREETGDAPTTSSGSAPHHHPHGNLPTTPPRNLPCRALRYSSVIVLFLVAIILLAKFHPQILKAILPYRKQLMEHRGGGVVVVLLVFIAWVLAMLPTTGFEIIVAYIYGFRLAVMISLLGKNIGSILAFAFARCFLKKRATQMAQKYALFAALGHATQQNCWKMVALVRLAYIPLGIKNIALSTLPVSFWTYSCVTIVANTPYTICWAWLGHSMLQATDVEKGQIRITGWQSKLMMGSSVAFTVILCLIAAHQTRKFYRYNAAEQLNIASQAPNDTPATMAETTMADASTIQLEVGGGSESSAPGTESQGGKKRHRRVLDWLAARLAWRSSIFREYQSRDKETGGGGGNSRAPTTAGDPT